jgi:hypothetical protein
LIIFLIQIKNQEELKNVKKSKEIIKHEDYDSLIEEEDDDEEESLVYNIPYNFNGPSLMRLHILFSIFIFIYFLFFLYIHFMLFVIFIFFYCLLSRFPNRRKIVLYTHHPEPNVLCQMYEFNQPVEFIYFTLSLSMWDVDVNSKIIKVYVKVFLFLILIYNFIYDND